MFRRTFLVWSAVLVGIVWAGLAPPVARADFEVLFSVKTGKGTDTVLFTVATDNGGTTKGGGSVLVTLSGGSTNAKTGAFSSQVFSTSGDDTAGAKSLTILNKGAVLFTLDGITVKTSISDSNSPGTPIVAVIDFGNTAITNTAGVAQTLTMTIGDTGFTAPSGASVLVSASISATAGGTNKADAVVTSDSYIDTTDAQFGTQQHVTPGSKLTLKKGDSGSDNVSSMLVGTPTPYSLTQVVGISLGAKDALVSAGGVTQVTAVPAPAGVLLALSGLPILGVSYLRRRFKRVTA